MCELKNLQSELFPLSRPLCSYALRPHKPFCWRVARPSSVYQQRLRIMACDENDINQKFELIDGKLHSSANKRICVGHEVGIDGNVESVALTASKCYGNNFAKINVIQNNEITTQENIDIGVLLEQARQEGYQSGFQDGQNSIQCQTCPPEKTCPEITCPEITCPEMTCQETTCPEITCPEITTTSSSSVTPNSPNEIYPEFSDMCRTSAPYPKIIDDLESILQNKSANVSTTVGSLQVSIIHVNTLFNDSLPKTCEGFYCYPEWGRASHVHLYIKDDADDYVKLNQYDFASADDQLLEAYNYYWSADEELASQNLTVELWNMETSMWNDLNYGYFYFDYIEYHDENFGEDSQYENEFIVTLMVVMNGEVDNKIVCEIPISVLSDTRLEKAFKFYFNNRDSDDSNTTSEGTTEVTSTAFTCPEVTCPEPVTCPPAVTCPAEQTCPPVNSCPEITTIENVTCPDITTTQETTTFVNEILPEFADL